jgi:hypothetical protein
MKIYVKKHVRWNYQKIPTKPEKKKKKKKYVFTRIMASFKNNISKFKTISFFLHQATIHIHHPANQPV